MALVIEDGSGLADATSYASADDLKAYAKARGITTLPTSTTDLEALLMRAMDRLEDYRRRWKGEPTYPGVQALAWPRCGVCLENWPQPRDEIPDILKRLQCRWAIVAQGTEIMPTKDINDPSGPVQSETVGPITTTYVNDGSVRRLPFDATAEALVAELLNRNGLCAVRA